MDEWQQKLEAMRKPYKPYTYQLAKNINAAFPALKVVVRPPYITLKLTGDKPEDLKTWLYNILELLPEIDHPLDTVKFIIKVNDTTESFITINPSEATIMALPYAIESKLKFSQSSIPYDETPLPLDHPYFNDNQYFLRKYRVGKHKTPLY